MDEKIIVRFDKIRGDVDHEFCSMLGYEGELHITSGDKWFNCDNGESVTFVLKSIVRKNDIIEIRTRLGNTFIFKIIPKHILAERVALRIRRTEAELLQMRREQESLK